MSEMNDYAQEQALKILESSFEMYERTKKEVERKMKDELNPDGSKKYTEGAILSKLKEIQDAQDDVKLQYQQTGGDVNKLLKIGKKKTGVKALKEMSKTTNTKNSTAANTKSKEVKDNKAVSTYIPKKRDYKTNVSYDVIPLPSKGQAYRNKLDRLQVAYLTANDENMFVSPNLYRDGLLIDFLLNEKIMEMGVDPSELLDGDRDAIILWLRATGYGNEFPITATDKATGKEFETIIDLSKIEFKDFNLVSDDNGWFTFVLPNSNDEVKFKFLNHREVEDLKKLDDMENMSAIKEKLASMSNDLRQILDNDTTLLKPEKSKLYEACRNIEDWYEDIEDDENYYTKTLTNRLNAQIMSINGNTNKQFIGEYIDNMNVRDSLALRKYIATNEPGLNFEVEIEKPESLGGGSQTVFLPLDQFIFLNIT